MPTDRTGENPLWKSAEPYYDDYYAIWDIFRSSAPLLTLIAPERETDIVRALVDLYRHEGWLPDARSGNYNGRTQGGSNAEFMLTDAYIKGLKGIDWKTALAAEMHDAEVSPEDHSKKAAAASTTGTSSAMSPSRAPTVPAPSTWNMPPTTSRSRSSPKASATMPPTKNILLAPPTGKNSGIQTSPMADSPASFALAIATAVGSTPFTAMDFCTWGGKTFYEGNSWTYSTFVPQDVAGLIAKSGGPETFVRRLDAFFDVPGRYDVGNEPGFLAPYLYIWAGRPDKTDARVRQIIAASYHSGQAAFPATTTPAPCPPGTPSDRSASSQRRPGHLPHR